MDVLSAILQFSIFSASLVDRQNIIAHQSCYHRLLNIFKRTHDLGLEQHRYLFSSVLRRLKSKFTHDNMYVQLGRLLTVLKTSIAYGSFSCQALGDNALSRQYLQAISEQHHNLDTSFCTLTSSLITLYTPPRRESAMSPASFNNFSNILFIQKLSSKYTKETSSK